MYMYVCVCMYVYVCVYVCMYVCMRPPYFLKPRYYSSSQRCSKMQVIRNVYAVWPGKQVSNYHLRRNIIQFVKKHKYCDNAKIKQQQ